MLSLLLNYYNSQQLAPYLCMFVPAANIVVLLSQIFGQASLTGIIDGRIIQVYQLANTWLYTNIGWLFDYNQLTGFVQFILLLQY